MNRSKKLNALLIALGAVAAVGYVVCIAGIIAILLSSDLLQRPFCVSSKCISLFTSTLEPALAIGKATSDLLVAVATAGGIVVALWSYFSSVENSALANHISHFATFQSYLSNEVAKRNRVHASSIDTFFWYNLIFPESKRGQMLVAETYKKFVVELNQLISESNALASTPTGKSFRYTEHQRLIRIQIQLIGVFLPPQPRIEYYEIEDQLMSLIAAINSAFCVGNNVPKLVLRKYS